MRKNVAGQHISFMMLSTAAGTKVTAGTPVVYVTKDNGAQATGTGAKTHKGNGEWSYAASQTETNADKISFSMELATAISQTLNVYPHFPQTVDNDTKISLIPTVTELNARTILSASYFDPAIDPVATVTTLTNLPSIPTNWITAIGITGGALNGKGDWNIGKTGYALSAIGFDLIGQSTIGMVEIAKAVWDRVLQGNTHNITNSAGKRLRQVDAAFVVTSGLAQAGTTNSITLAIAESASDNIFDGDRVLIVAGTGIGEHAVITAYNGTTKVASIHPDWVTTPDATSEYELNPASVDIQTWDYAVVTKSATTNLPQVDIKSISDNTGNADSITEARLSELDAGTSGKMANQIDVIHGLIDTEIADILLDTSTTLDSKLNSVKAITDQMVFTVANLLNVNTKAVNDSTEAADDMKTAAETMVKGTAATGTLSTTEMTTNLIINVAGQYDGAVLTFDKNTVTAALRSQRTNITATTILNGKLGFTGLTTAPVNGDTFILV